MNFSDALMCLKGGDKLARLAWKPPGDRYLSFRSEDGATISDNWLINGENVKSDWHPEQPELLADDWVQVE